MPGSCAAGWTPPDAPPWPRDRSERFEALLERHCTQAEIERLGALDAAQQAHHPEQRLWYLGVIATVPAAQGHGDGSALLEHTLVIVDRASLPAYLESTNPRNVPFYERHGFEATGHIDLPDGPSLTTMWRDASGI
jgi:GNAT superfamily N-acetyltransferase